MRRALAVGFVGCIIGAIAACVGGPGPLPDQGPEGTDVSEGASSSGGAAPTTTANPKSPPSPIMASSFDGSCTTDADCAAIYEGDPCASCKCPNASIGKKDLQKYASALASAVQSCTPSTSGAQCDCASVQVGCDTSAKKCRVGASAGDAGR